jgi:hypothetical protein
LVALEKVPLIQPEHPIKIVWDLVLALIRAYFLLVIPLYLAIIDV